MKCILNFLATACLLLAAACSSTPDYVISRDKMASLLADIHEADAVVELDRQKYQNNDSAKKILKQSLLANHGITEQQFDTSLFWYGHNMDIYKELYDDVVKILEAREKDVVADMRKAGEKATLLGDSVDIWHISPRLIFDRRQTGKYAELTFSLPSDENSRQGDRFEWHFMLRNGKGEAKALIGVDYADGCSEYQTKDIEMDKSDMIVIQSDSLRTVNRIFGYLIYHMHTESAVFADSIMLYRTRLNKERYRFHGRQTKYYTYGDSAVTDTTSR